MADRSTQLDQLQSEMRSCRKCLHAGHDVTAGAIFSGDAGADLMIIGQAPGVTEVEAGRPFNAGSGTRLFEWLAAADIDEADFRRRQYMTSVTKCFPGKATSGGGDRVPSSEERELSRPYLAREIELVDPAIVIPVGRLAINLYFPKSRPLTKIIGAEIQAGSRWVIPLPHPSGASRWHQIASNRTLIEKAVERIKQRRQQLGV